MKKAVVLSLVVLCISIKTIAQEGKFKFGVGPEISYIVGTYDQRWNVGVGASAQAEYFFSDKVSMTLLGGFNGYIGNGSNSTITQRVIWQPLTIIPIRAGARYYIGESFNVGAQLGVGFKDGGDGSSTGFAYSPQIGYNFSTKDDKSLDISIKYDGYAFGAYSPSNNPHQYIGGGFGAVGIRVGYIF